MSLEPDLQNLCENLANQAQAASRALAAATTAQKNEWLLAAAEAIEAQCDSIRAANDSDVSAARLTDMTTANLDRLTLTPARIRAMAEGLRQVAALPDPVGEIREDAVRPNGLRVQKIGVPLGVIFFLYESRPNVTIDAAGLCAKAGNAVILRGGKEAVHTNRALHAILERELVNAGLPAEAVQLVPTLDRAAVGLLLKMHERIDLVIPRGGESLIRRVAAEASMPVLKHYQGNCHVYVDEHADLAMAERIILNGKCQRPGVCNATESLLVHAAIAGEFLPRLGNSLREAGVEVRGCPRTAEWISEAKPATDADYAAEFLDLILSVKVVTGLSEALEHIRRFSSKHTDAIVTGDPGTAREFAAKVDSAAVVVNASTRFNDGFEIGLGAEIGISTDKFHARGPCGLRELTSYKYILTGNGQIRV